MNWIPWDDILRMGHPTIDAEHLRLVELFNKLISAARRNEGTAVCCAVLDEIIEHSVAHFALEERLMAEHRYPQTAEHNIEHARLIRQAHSYKSKVEADLPGSHIDLRHFPEDWLTRHILTADKALTEFLAEKGIVH